MNTVPSAPFQNERTTQSAYTPQGKRGKGSQRAVQGQAARFDSGTQKRASEGNWSHIRVHGGRPL